MVSATINEASKNPRLNKDGSVKKRAGRKAKVSNLSTVVRLEPETKLRDIPIPYMMLIRRWSMAI